MVRAELAKPSINGGSKHYDASPVMLCHATFRRGREARQHGRRRVKWAIPELRVDQFLAEILDAVTNVFEGFERCELNNEHVARLGWVIGVSLDEVVELGATPF